MKKRVIWKMLLLTIVTLGIYRLYWFVKTRKEMMTKDPSVKILSPLLFVIPIVTVMLAFGYFVVSLLTAYDLPSQCQNYSYNSSISSSQPIQPEACQADPSSVPVILLYASFLIIWPLAIIWLWSYSKGVEKITNGKTSFAIAMIVLVAVPDGIDILIIQDAYNKLGAKV